VTLDDLTRVQWPSAPRLSPDGRWVAYGVEDRIYVVAAHDRASRAVTAPGTKASDPRWSRDGRSLYFLSDRGEKKWQVWKLPINTFGEAEPLTAVDRGVEELKLSPDESRLLLTLKGDAAQKSDAPAKAPTGDKPKAEPWVITRLQLKQDAEDGYLSGDRAEHLYVYDIASKNLRQITSGEYSESEAAWSPDGKRVVFSSNREKEPDATYRSDLWLVDAGNTDEGKTLQRLTDDEWTKGSPVFSPDGKSIAYITAEDGVYALQQIAVIPASGGSPRLLTQGLERWIDEFRFSPDGEWIYFLYENLGGSHLGRVRVRDGKIERLLEGERQISSLDVAANGTVVARIENLNDAPEIYSFTRGKLTRLSALNDAFLREIAIGAKEKVEFKSPDGTAVEAFVTKPPGFDGARKYPTILQIHGGPVGQVAYGFDTWIQYLAANGYVIVEPNPRGSTGRDEAFIRAIYQTWGITDYDDVIAAVDHVIKLGYADPERLGVTGYSYGGYMTNTVITRTTRFKAAVSGAGHSLIIANYGHDIYQKWYNWELGVPWENPEKYARLSPLLQVAKVETPTLFVGGRDDWNVPVLNAELFYQSLKKRGIDTQLVVYPGVHHGDWPEEYEKDRLLRIRQWFDHYLHVGPVPAAAP
jgi:dipeptidyl aminopeptidase/acylaminoacyl peptidase